MQNSMGYSAWPGFGQGGAPHYQQPAFPPGQFGGGAYGGGGFGNFGGFNFFPQGGPGSYASPGSMQYGGGSGFYGGGSPFARQARRQDQAQQLRGRTTPFGGVSNRHPLSSFLRLPGQDIQKTEPGNNEIAMTGGSPNPFLSMPPQQGQRFDMNALTGGRGGFNWQQGMGGGPRNVAPAQRVQQYLNYRSPFSGGGSGTQYGPQMQSIQMY